MVEFTRARGADARALAAAIFVGSGAGAVLGAAYLAAGPAHRATLTPTAVPAPLAVATVAGPTVVPAVAPVHSAAAPIAAQPFRFAAVAGAANDVQCLTEAVYFEARGEPRDGQQAVAQVVLNRVRHPAFPKTICAVVHQRTEVGCQFSFACQPEPRGRDEAAWKRAEAVARGALHGSVMREIGDATHFESVRAAAFAGLLKVAQIGEHVFYRFGGRAGAAGMFHQTPAPSAAPKLVVASLTEPTTPALPGAQASKVPTPAQPAPQPAASLAIASATPTRAVARVTPGPATPPSTAVSPTAVSTAVPTPAVAKPIPAAPLKPSVAATSVAQS